ncbi:hypothetical protein PV11_02988 [Exophiala sideris]|uniref:Uncharacterized protein n=1 Tax=Exophiala sideris TaxID=1016849 RepID=A0A0D1ZKW8_9EURO|nr:hypothetical protein PV11_02988 [Exophiala sideris]
MVILGGLELVAAGYLLKEVSKDSKGEEDHERRRRRHHSKHRDDHNHSHGHSHGHHHSHNRYDDSPPGRHSRPPHQSSLAPPQNQGPPRPFSAPPIQARPPVMPPGPPPMAWQQQHPPPQGLPQSHSTWPMQQNQQQRPGPPPQHWPQPPPHQGGPPPPHPNGANFVAPPLQRPATVMLPPANMHYDMKTGKWQNNMLPPEMLGAQGKRDAGPELRRENSMPESYPHTSPGQTYHEYNAGMHPQINVTDHHGRPAAPTYTMSSPSLPQGYAELDSETPGRYRPHGDEKASYEPQRSHRRRRGHSSSSTRYYDDDDEMSPPPAYRE